MKIRPSAKHLVALSLVLFPVLRTTPQPRAPHIEVRRLHVSDDLINGAVDPAREGAAAFLSSCQERGLDLSDPEAVTAALLTRFQRVASDTTTPEYYYEWSEDIQEWELVCRDKTTLSIDPHLHANPLVVEVTHSVDL